MKHGGAPTGPERPLFVRPSKRDFLIFRPHVGGKKKTAFGYYFSSLLPPLADYYINLAGADDRKWVLIILSDHLPAPLKIKDENLEATLPSEAYSLRRADAVQCHGVANAQV